MVKVEVEIKNFQKNLDTFLQKAEKNKKQILTDVAFKFKRMVTNTTPVALIKGGRARAGWYIRKKKVGWIVGNRVEYIVRLEYGHSKQAPSGMVRIALKELSRDYLKMK